MTNTSNVSLSYNWDILEFENLHRPITAQRSFIKTALPFDRQKSVFTISPNSGSIKAGQSERFVVEFRPDDMRQLKGMGQKLYYVIITSFNFFGFFKPITVGAVCRIPNQSPEAVPIELSLSGKGQLPAIHFSLPEEGSYVENKQGVKLNGHGHTKP